MNKKDIMEAVKAIGEGVVIGMAINAVVTYAEILRKQGLKGRPVMVETTPSGRLKITTIKEDK